MFDKIPGKTMKPFWIMCMVTSYLMFSYYYFEGWWYSGLGTLLIIFFAFLIWPDHFLYRIGLKVNASTLILSLMLTTLLTAGGYGLMKEIAGKNEVIIEYSTIRNFIHDIFYTMNEEIILGAVLLGILQNAFKKFHPIFISVLVALIFTVFHYIFYRWIFLENGVLTFSTLHSLFCVGILRNNLILTTRHIGFSWSFHVSWMAIMFGTNHYFLSNGESLSELTRFNMYLGSPVIILIISVLMFVSFCLYWPKFKIPVLTAKL